MPDKVLIIQNYNANKGDASVVSAMLDSMKDDPSLEFSLTSYDPAKAEETYGIQARDFLISARRIRTSRGIYKYIYLAMEILFILYMPLWYCGTRCGISMPLSKARKAIIDLYRQADAVILPGGHFFTSFNGVFSNLSHTIGIFAAFALKKKTMIYAQTLGPFWGWKGILEKWMFLRVLKRINTVTVRDQRSLDTFGKYHPGMQLTAEIVFAAEVPELRGNARTFIQHVRENGRKVLCVTIHHIYYKHFFSREDYVKLMAGSLAECVKTYDLNLVMIPMEDGMHGGGDREIIHEILNLSGIPGDHLFMPQDELSSADTA